MKGATWRETRGEMAAGWKLVLTGFFGLSLGTTGIFIYTQGLFIRPLEAEFGWTRTEVAAMPTIFGLTLAISYPLMGVLLDRLGTRAVATTAILCLAGGFFALSMMKGSLASYMAIILFIALFGSGTATSYVRLVGSGFAKARGLALGITMTGTGITALLAPGILGAYLQTHGWRLSYQALAATAFIALPLVLLFAKEPARLAGQFEAPGLTVGQAMRTRTFWLMGLGFACGGAGIPGLLPHFIPLLQEGGMSPAESGALAGAIGLAIIFSRLLTGFLCDHLFAPHVTAGVLALSAVGCLGLLLIGPSFALAAALLIGLGLGAEIDLAGYMSARYFGLRSYGGVLGVQYGLFGAGSGLGAFAFGVLYDRFGDYQVALAVAAGLLGVGIICALFLGAYPEHAKSRPVSASGSSSLGRDPTLAGSEP